MSRYEITEADVMQLRHSARAPSAATRGGERRTQRELVIASLLECPDARAGERGSRAPSSD